MVFVHAAAGPMPAPSVGGMLTTVFTTGFGCGNILAGLVVVLLVARKLYSKSSVGSDSTALEKPDKESGQDTQLVSETKQNVVSALINLGYPRKPSERAVEASRVPAGADFDALFRESLKHLAK